LGLQVPAQKWNRIPGAVRNRMFIVAAAAGLCGCTSYEVGQRDLNVLEKEGMALARTLSAPIDLFGPTWATYGHLYNESDTHVAWKVLGTPFVPLLTLPSGAFAMTADVLTGPVELLTFSQFSGVAYPWESYEYHVAERWNEITPVILVALATAGAGAAAIADSHSGGGSRYNSGYTPSYANTGGGSGAAAVNTAPSQSSPTASKPRTDIYTRNCSKHGEYDSRFSLGGCPECKAPRFAD
jgi:hypothetical protein